MTSIFWFWLHRCLVHWSGMALLLLTILLLAIHDASHAGWTEVTAYSQATRPAATFGSATVADPSVIDNSGFGSGVFDERHNNCWWGFSTSDDTKSGTSGILFSASDFQSPGDRSVVSGDTLNVTYEFSLDAA
jgi:hypothetical protein